MSDQRPANAPQAAPEPPPRGMPTWVKALLFISIILMVAGVALPMLGVIQKEPAAVPKALPGPGAGLTPGGTPPPAGGGGVGQGVSDAVQYVKDHWGSGLFRLGFSFFAGFVVAYALRALFGWTVMAIAFAILVLLGLQYAGLVEVHWTAFQQRADAAGSWFSAQFESFKTFATGAIPSMGLAGLGFVAGWWR